MYDELVKRLRTATTLPVMNALCQEAADAIEELQKALDAVNDAHNEGYDVGYWAGRRDYEPKWIPVTEQLPDSGVCVLVTDGLEVGEGWLTEITNTRGYFMRWCAPTADIDVDRRPIAYWMPLPTPPTAEEGET